jgi:hypothetical protein
VKHSNGIGFVPGQRQLREKRDREPIGFVWGRRPLPEQRDFEDFFDQMERLAELVAISDGEPEI